MHTQDNQSALMRQGIRINGKRVVTRAVAEQLVQALFAEPASTRRPIRVRLYKPGEFVAIRAAILAEFNGVNQVQLAEKYQLQIMTVNRVVNEARTDGRCDPAHRNQPE